LVQTRWNSLPREQCEGIKNYIVSLVIKTSSVEISSKPEKIFLNKLNLLLVQILKHEWPKHWPNFISEIVTASRTSLPLCENNMIILKLLSEEAFDFSAEQMTTVKAKNLKTQLSGEFSEIFKLCIEILELANRPSLILATLEALLRFLKWIPLGYVFQTNLLETLCNRFLNDAKYRSVCMSCLTEISGLNADQENAIKVVQMLQGVIDVLNGYYPMSPSLNFVNLYQDERSDNPRFIQNSALFLTTCLGKHLKSLEQQTQPDLLIVAHNYLLRISAVDDREVFKICLEYWDKFVDGLYQEVSGGSSSSSGLFLDSFNRGAERKNMYSNILSNLRSVMIDKMVKPEEVLIVEDENGDIVREHVKESDVLAIYAVMRETLVFLTHLDSEDTKRIMLGRLSNQFENANWNRNELNRICWAVGSISGSMNEEMEKSFVIQVIRDLLSLCEMKKGKDNKAVVASNIMYVVGQYPRFLRQHWKFLKTVVNKLFEFMHELHEGVQDMACETFITITKTCHRQFVTFQAGENELFVDEIIRRMNSIINDLTVQQIHFFYEAMGHLIRSQPDLVAQNGEIVQIMSSPNESWDSIIAAISSNTENIKNSDNLKGLSACLKTNLNFCESLGSPFMAQLSRIYMDMLSLYRLSSKSIGEAIKHQGLVATKTPIVRSLRAVKKDVLRLVEAYVQTCDNGPVFVENFVPVLLDAILSDYNQSIEQARDAEVLSVTATIISRFSLLMNDKIAPILDSVFECTLNMINKDFVEFPEHRVNFFKLISAINVNCFDALLRLNRIHFKLIVDSCVWAFKHAHREIAETGLKICYDLLKNISGAASAAPSFYQAFYLSLFTDIFYVLTDGEHKSGFRYQSMILAHLFEIVESGLLQVPLYPSDSSFTDNRAFVRDYLSNMLRTSFPHLQPSQIDTFIRGLFDLNRDPVTFKAHLRDFLISLKEFSENSQELYLEEIELEQERKKRADKDAASKIPGMLKPLEAGEDSD
jgi:exportin-1